MQQNQPMELGQATPADFWLSVLMEQCPSENVWIDYQWRLLGVTATTGGDEPEESGVSLVHQQNDTKQFLYRGLRLQLHVDECESYYHNLCSSSPCCFVIASEDTAGNPVPFLVSLSFDEAHAYQEGEELVYSVAMPPELYRWCELFVLNHYVPEQRKKRKRSDWRNAGDGRQAS